MSNNSTHNILHIKWLFCVYYTFPLDTQFVSAGANTECGSAIATPAAAACLGECCGLDHCMCLSVTVQWLVQLSANKPEQRTNLHSCSI